MCDIACNGQIGVEMCGAQKYDAILLDVVLPDADGVHRIKRLKECDERAPILCYLDLTALKIRRCA